MNLTYTLTYKDGYSYVTIPQLEGEELLRKPEFDYDNEEYLDIDHFCFMASFDPYDSDVFTTIAIQKEGGDSQSARATSYYEQLTREEADYIISEIIRTSLELDDFELETDSQDLIEENEDFDDEEDDVDEDIEWEDYVIYPFAMETVNGEIINLDASVQTTIKKRLLKELHVSENALCIYLDALGEDSSYEDDRFDAIFDCEYDSLKEILGFDGEKFAPEGIGFLESGYGWDAKELMERLGFELEEVLSSSGYGVVYLSELDDEDDDSSDEMISLDFDVTVCLGGGDGGDVSVTVDVTKEEYELLKQCCREYEDIDSYDGLEELCKRIIKEAEAENDYCMENYSDSDEEIDYGSVSFMISMPSEIQNEIDEEEEEKGE